jgi:hypothetical protein
VQSVSYAGSSGTGNAPVFGASATLPLSGSGTHTFALKNAKGLNFIDQICVTDGSSSSQPAAAPGETTTSNDTVQPHDTLEPDQLFVPLNAKSVEVLAESTVSAPYAIAVLDPLGNVVNTATASNGIASLSVPVSGFGLYSVQVINLGVGPVNVWTAATPQLATG